jgi:DNA-binding SARP family transcriptional activator
LPGARPGSEHADVTPPTRKAASTTPLAAEAPVGKARSLDSTPLEIRLFGELELRVGGTPLPRLESARAESLLAYLLLHREAAQPRQRLAFLLWPDSTEAQARTNLRHVLHNLRRRLPDADRYLEVEQRTLRWRTDADFRLDVAAFDEALSRAAAAGAESPLEPLRDAVEAYAGDLLEGCYDEWLLEEREGFRQRHLDALERLAELLAELGEHAQAIPYAEQLMRRDPLREQTHRLLMRLYDARGDRARALRAYHTCAAILERELGIEPSPATREVYEGLLLVSEPAAGRPRAGRLAGPVLVGRAAERTQLAALWRASASGRAQLVLVTGDAGIGKTRLVEELRSSCAHRGALTAEARSYHAEGALAYGPVVAWLRSEALAARWSRLDRARLSELGRLLPELAAGPGLAATEALPEALPESEQRQRLFDALLRAILAADAPLLLVADDLQWADAETLQFVHYLLRSEPDARLLVAATARREELDRHHPLNDLLTGLRSLERLVDLELAPLSRQETALLAEQFSGRALAEPAADRLFGETGGNPLYVVETLRSGWSGDQPVGSWITPKVQAVIESRLAQLPDTARELVDVAATIGREFSSDLVAAAADMEEADLVRGLDELWRRRIIGERGSEAYDFSHEKVREVAYLSLGPARRRRHHLRVASALESLHASDLTSVSAQLASHFDLAGVEDEAVRWYPRAAEAAQAVHANLEAIRLLDRALELLRRLPETPERKQRELTLHIQLLAPLASVEGTVSGRLIEAQQRALELGGGLEVEPAPPLLRSLAITSLSRGRLEEAGEVGARLRARGEQDADPVLLVEADYVLGVSAFWQGELATARRHFEAAVERYRPEQRSTHLVRYGLDPKVVCLSRLGNTYGFLGRTEAATGARDSALALADEIGHLPTVGTALVFAALLSFELRDEEGLRRYSAALEPYRGNDGPKAIAGAAEGFAGYVDVLDARGEHGRRRIERALADLQGTEHAPGQHATLLRLLLEACAVTGAARAGLDAADPSLTAGAGARLWEAETRRLHAEFLTALGAREAEIEADLAEALRVARHQGAKLFELRAATAVLRRRGESGDGAAIREARELVAAALDALPEGGGTVDRDVAEALLARR